MSNEDFHFGSLCMIENKLVSSQVLMAFGK